MFCLEELLSPACRQGPKTPRRFLNLCTARAGSELASLMSFLLQLGFQDPNTPLALSSLDAPQQAIAAHMAQLGVLTPFTVPDDKAQVRHLQVL